MELSKLAEIAEETLGGLEAGPALKYKIAQRAKGGRKPVYRVLAALCALVVVVGGFAVTLPLLQKGSPALIDSLAAGQSLPESARKTSDVLPGGVTLTRGARTNAQTGVWAAENNGSFPLLCVNGRFYRMLETPDAVQDALKGELLGVVGVYTSTPELADAAGVMSNAAQTGEAVYAAAGMRGAVALARVNGTLRAFQRVSFGASAVLGAETLADTLRAEDVAALELSGVGGIYEKAEAERLVRVLLANASYLRSSGADTGDTLLIHLNNGLTLQLIAGDGTVSACGEYACPEFFEAFTAASK